MDTSLHQLAFEVSDAPDALGPTVIPGESSIPVWGSPSFLFPHLELRDAVSATFEISRIGLDYTTPCLMYGSNLRTTSDGLWAGSPQALPPGLYVLSACELTNATGERVALTRLGLGASFFEVAPLTSVDRGPDEVLAALTAVAAHRLEDLKRGFRVGEELDTDRDYEVYVFAKNCVLSRPMRLSGYTLQRVAGLGCADEIRAYEGFFAEKGLPLVGNADAAMTDASANQPAFVACFPRVYAATIDQAMRAADEEVDRLCGVLALHRAAAASKFATVGRDPRTGQTRYGVHTPRFLGNYATGEIAGESPEVIRQNVDAVRESQRLQMYVSLLREALGEQNRDIAYFRLWNLLEAIITFRDDADGGPILSRVAELLRETYTAAGWSDATFAQCVEHATIDEMTVIWKRRRNCMAHSGGCSPLVSHVCKTSGKWVSEYQACRDALSEMRDQNESVHRANDQYLRIMTEIVEMVVKVECARAP